MYKKLLVAVATVAVLGNSLLPIATTMADVLKVSDPVTNTVATLPAGSYSVLTMRVTAYTSDVAETDDTPFITANGSIVHDGTMASNMLPFGTKVKIPALFGDKIFTVEDRMSPKFYRTVDVWMNNKKQAINFGMTYAKIVVLGTSTYAQSAFETKDISANLR